MYRRRFLTSLAAAGAGLAAGAARADYADRVLIGAYYPVRVNQNGESTRIDHLVVTDGHGTLSIDWRSGAPLYYEDRVDLSGVGGGIGSLFRTPFRVRWRRAQPLGTVEIHRGRNMLVAQVADASALLGRGATIGAGDYSWDLPGVLAPAPTPAGGGQPAGAIRIDGDGRLLVSLPQMVAQI